MSLGRFISRASVLCMSGICLGTLALVAGCSGPGPAPYGPGAASKADLRPWVAHAPVVIWVGQLNDFWVVSLKGNYPTWALGPAGRYEGCELDVRACSVAANRLRDQRVIVQGHLIDRGQEHMPLVVADWMEPLPPATSEQFTRLTW